MLNPLAIGVTLGGSAARRRRAEAQASCWLLIRTLCLSCTGCLEDTDVSGRGVTRHGGHSRERRLRVSPLGTVAGVASFAVKFLGCKVSQADAMLARSALLAAGHAEAPEAEAELHVINTCCITSEAEAKSRQSVRRSLKTAREVYVAGCAVNLNAGSSPRSTRA